MMQPPVRKGPELPYVFLKPGQLFLNERKPVQPVKIITVLGSCISLILTKESKGLAAMCHAFMPYCPAGKNCGGNCPDPYKYVKCALHNMLLLFYRHGLRGSEIEVRLFGGADMFVSGWGVERDGRVQSVGLQNVEMAQAMIRAEHLRLTESDTGGTCGRKILFFPHSGEVQVRRLKGFGKPG